MMTKEAYMALYEKCNAGLCSAEEMRLLESYRDAFELTDSPWDEATMGQREQTKQRIRQRLYKKISRSRSRDRKHTLYRWSRYVAAAVVVSVTVVSFGLHHYFIPASKVTADHAPIVPGGNKALLTLDDGTQIVLDKAGIGDLANRGDVRITKLSDGQLVYNYQRASPQHPIENRYHTVSTPRGGQYQINLSDGTKVWLNAASSIRFPAVFPEQERAVEVTGEVYFEVARHEDKPFVVIGNEQRITVLGTHFNVKAYPDDAAVETALLHGKVRVTINDKDYTLQPGQRTTFDKRKKQVQMDTFNPEEAIAWQAGQFIFNAEPVESVMRKIARWYDVDVTYRGNMKGKVFTGAVSRYDNVQEILNMLALTGTVNFKIDGRRIIVME